jgi:hypothetical protein
VVLQSCPHPQRARQEGPLHERRADEDLSLDLGSCIARFLSGNIADGDGSRPNLVQVGPFFEENKLKVWMNEMAIRLSHAAIVLTSNPEGIDLQLLNTRTHYLEVCNEWWSKYRGMKPQARPSVGKCRLHLSARRAGVTNGFRPDELAESTLAISKPAAAAPAVSPS